MSLPSMLEEVRSVDTMSRRSMTPTRTPRSSSTTRTPLASLHNNSVWQSGSKRPRSVINNNTKTPKARKTTTTTTTTTPATVSAAKKSKSSKTRRRRNDNGWNTDTKTPRMSNRGGATTTLAKPLSLPPSSSSRNLAVDVGGGNNQKQRTQQIRQRSRNNVTTTSLLQQHGSVDHLKKEPQMDSKFAMDVESDSELSSLLFSNDDEDSAHSSSMTKGKNVTERLNGSENDNNKNNNLGQPPRKKKPLGYPSSTSERQNQPKPPRKDVDPSALLVSKEETTVKLMNSEIPSARMIGPPSMRPAKHPPLNHKPFRAVNQNHIHNPILQKRRHQKSTSRSGSLCGIKIGGRRTRLLVETVDEDELTMDGFQSDATTTAAAAAAAGFADSELPSLCEDVYGTSSANQYLLYSTMEDDSNIGSDSAFDDLPSRCEDVYGKRRYHHHSTTTTKQKSRYSPPRTAANDDNHFDELPDRCEDVYNNSGLLLDSNLGEGTNVCFTGDHHHLQSSGAAGFSSSANQKGRTTEQSITSISPRTVEVWTLPDDDVSVNSKTFVFDMNGKMYMHPPLPPGWTLTVSKSCDRPWYSHPDYGLTDKCPVPLPVKRMGSKGPEAFEKQELSWKGRGSVAKDSQREAHVQETGSDLSTCSASSSECSNWSLKATSSTQKQQRSRSSLQGASSPISSESCDMDSNDSLATRSVIIPKGLRLPAKFQQHRAVAVGSRGWNANAESTTTTRQGPDTSASNKPHAPNKLVDEDRAFSYDADNEDMDVASSASEEDLFSTSPPQSQKNVKHKNQPDESESEDDDMNLTTSPSSQNLLFSPTSNEGHKQEEEEADSSSQLEAQTSRDRSPASCNLDRKGNANAETDRPAECQDKVEVVVTQKHAKSDNAKYEITEKIPEPTPKTDSKDEMVACLQPPGTDTKIESMSTKSEALSNGDDGSSTVGVGEERESDQEKVEALKSDNQSYQNDEFSIVEGMEEQINEEIERGDFPPSTNDPETPVSDQRQSSEDETPSKTTRSSHGRTFGDQPRDTKPKASDNSQKATHQVSTPKATGQASDSITNQDDTCPIAGATPPTTYTPSPSRSKSNNTASSRDTRSVRCRSITGCEEKSPQGSDEDLESSVLEDGTPLQNRVVSTTAHAASRHRMDKMTLNKTLNEPTSDRSPDSQSSSEQLPTAVNLDERFPAIGGEDISEIGSPSSSMRSTPAQHRARTNKGTPSGDSSCGFDSGGSFSAISIPSIRMEKGREKTDVLQSIMELLPKTGRYAGPYKFRPRASSNAFLQPTQGRL